MRWSGKCCRYLQKQKRGKPKIMKTMQTGLTIACSVTFRSQSDSCRRPSLGSTGGILEKVEWGCTMNAKMKNPDLI